MNWIDAVTIILCVVLAVKGVFKGLVLQIFSLLGVIFGVYCAVHYHEHCLPYLYNIGIKETSAIIVSYVATFFAVYIVAFVLGKFLSNVFKALTLGLFDKFLGALMGIVKALLIMSIFCFCYKTVQTYNPDINPNVLTESKLYQILQDFLNIEEIIEDGKQSIETYINDKGLGLL